MKKKYCTPLLMASLILSGTFAVTSCNRPNESVVTKDFLYGSGVPESTLGVDGKTYINTDNGDKYIKNNGAWLKVEPTKIEGEGEPSKTLGQPGDEYIDTVTKAVYRKINEVEWLMVEPGTTIKETLLGSGKPDKSIGTNGQAYVDIDTGDKYIKNGDDWLKVEPTKLTGEGEPANSLGEIGDEYLDTKTNIVYRKIGETEWKAVKYPEVVEKHTVTFDLDGGRYGKDIAIPAQQVENGKIAVEPLRELINKEHCTFDDWYDGKHVWNFHTPVYTDLHLVAKYTVNEDQKITFKVDPANGEKPYEMQSFRGESPRIENPSKDGYDFIGWFIDGGDTQYPGYVNEEIKGKTLVAKYEKAKFNFKYELTPENEVVITGLHNLDTVNVIIPDYLDGRPVVKIAPNAFSSKTKITQIFIGKNVREIDARAFMGCRALNKIEVDQTNTHFTSLKGALYTKSFDTLVFVPQKYQEKVLTLANTTTVVGPYAVYGQGYEGISSVEFNEGLEVISNNAFQNCDALSIVLLPTTLKTIGESAFSSYGEGSIQKITWHEGLLEIGAYAFSGQYLKEDIIIPDTVKKIGSSAFNNNNSIVTVSLPRDLEILDGNPFTNMFGLRNFKISDDAKNFAVKENIVYSKDFSTLYLVPGQMYQKNFSWASGVRNIAKEAFFSCDELDTIEIPDTVQNIGEAAFYNCFGTSKIVIPNSVTTIGEEAFGNCSALTDLTIGTGINNIPKYAFSNCSGLTDLNIPSNIKTISDYAFFGANKLQNINLAEGVESIGLMSFKFVPTFSEDVPISETSKLIKLKMPNSLISIANYAFDGHDKLNELTIGTGLKELSRLSFADEAPLGSISGLTKNPYMNLDNNIVYSEDFKTLYLATANVAKDIALKDGIEVIKPYAFARLKMTDVIMPDSIRRIEEGAFYSTELTEFVMPANLTFIGEGAFWSVDTLTNIKWNEALETIDPNAFTFCGMKSIAFPDSLKSIGEDAFGLCSNLETISFGTHLEYLGDTAFKRCSKLGGEITLPATLSYYGKGVFNRDDILNANKITAINIDPANPNYKSENGMVLTKDGKTLVAYAPGNAQTSLVIPETVENVADYGLAEAFKLTSLTLPSNLKTIGQYSFSYLQGVDTLVIPASVEYIDDRAFYGIKITATINFNCTLKYARTHFNEGYLNGVNTSEVIINYLAEEGSDKNE